jgi:hypothetical protein
MMIKQQIVQCQSLGQSRAAIQLICWHSQPQAAAAKEDQNKPPATTAMQPDSTALVYSTPGAPQQGTPQHGLSMGLWASRAGTLPCPCPSSKLPAFKHAPHMHQYHTTQPASHTCNSHAHVMFNDTAPLHITPSAPGHRAEWSHACIVHQAHSHHQSPLRHTSQHSCHAPKLWQPSSSSSILSRTSFRPVHNCNAAAGNSLQMLL